MTFRKAVRQDLTHRIKAVFRIKHSIRTNTLVKVVIKVVTKVGVVDMEAIEVVGTTTTGAAAGSVVAGIRDSPRESPWSIRPRESPWSMRP